MGTESLGTLSFHNFGRVLCLRSAGMSAAYHLRKHGPADLDVVLLEASSEKIGGHANTLSKGLPTPVDAGNEAATHALTSRADAPRASPQSFSEHTLLADLYYLKK